MMFLPSTPFVPVSAIFAETDPVETSGLTMYHATPALLCAGFVSKLTAVSSALHTLPFAYITCCIRVSFESSLETTSSCAGSPTKKSRQQPIWPLRGEPGTTSTVVVLLTQ